MKKTLPYLFENSVYNYPENILMWDKRTTKYIGTTYSEMQPLVHKFAAGLISLGFRKGDRASLIAEGRREWVVAELGILFAGGVNVPISIKIDQMSDLKFRIAHSGSKFAIVSKGQLQKIKAIKIDLPDLEKTIILDNIDNPENDEIILSDILKRGEEYLKQNSKEFTDTWQGVNESDHANICYTSGTTSDPKGIILTHRNYTANIEQSSALLPIPVYYTSLLILPWDHAFAHTAGIYTLMANGASMAAIQLGSSPLETLKNIPLNIKENKPYFLLSVPTLAKSFRKNIENGIREKGERVEKLFNYALKTAYEYNKEGWNKGTGISKLKKPILVVLDKILFSKIRENFGGRLEFFVGGGALLDIELQRFFYAIGIPMFQGYGLTEAAPVISANVPLAHKLGSSGKIVKDLLVKICDEEGNEVPIGQNGEIVIKGENVMAGYWKNEKATGETIKDGWLFTGDLGYLDNENFLYVLGRFKSLLIAGDGEKYSPEGIEETITDNSPYIDQMMLYNNQSPYTVALLYPNKDAIQHKLKSMGLDSKSGAGQKEALKIIQDEINKYKKGGEYGGEFPERWLPAAVAVLGEGFTEQNKFLNSTMKMVRGKISEYYASRIEFLFTAEAKNIANHQNTTIISRW